MITEQHPAGASENTLSEPASRRLAEFPRR